MLMADAEAGKVMVAEAERSLLMAEAEAGKMIVAEAKAGKVMVAEVDRSYAGGGCRGGEGDGG